MPGRRWRRPRPRWASSRSSTKRAHGAHGQHLRHGYLDPNNWRSRMTPRFHWAESARPDPTVWPDRPTISPNPARERHRDRVTLWYSLRCGRRLEQARRLHAAPPWRHGETGGRGAGRSQRAGLRPGLREHVGAQRAYHRLVRLSGPVADGHHPVCGRHDRRGQRMAIELHRLPPLPRARGKKLTT